MIEIEQMFPGLLFIQFIFVDLLDLYPRISIHCRDAMFFYI